MISITLHTDMRWNKLLLLAEKLLWISHMLRAMTPFNLFLFFFAFVFISLEVQ